MRFSHRVFWMVLGAMAAAMAPVAVLLYYREASLARALEGVAGLTPAGRVALDISRAELLDALGAGFVAMLAAALVASYVLGRLMDRSLSEFMRVTRELASGNLDARVEAEGEWAGASAMLNATAAKAKATETAFKRASGGLTALPEPLWISDEEGTITYVNEAFTRELGYAPDEAVGSIIFDFLDEHTEQAFRRHLLNAGEEGFAELDGRFITKHEGIIPVALSSGIVHEPDGNLSRVGLVRDMRASRASLDALTSEKERLGLFIDSIADQIIVIDRNYVITSANRAARIIHGRELNGETCHSAMFGREEKCHLHGHECPGREAMESGHPAGSDYSMRLPNGREAYMEVLAFPVLDRDGAATGAVINLRDISDRMRIEREVEQKNRELQALNSISRILSQSLRSEDIYRQALERIIGLFSMDGGGIYIIDDSGREMDCKFYRGLSSSFAHSVIRVHVGRDIPGMSAESGSAIMMEDISADPRAEGSAFRHSGMRSFACVPVRGKEKLLGVFFVFSFSPRAWAREDEGTLNSISEMMGISFENIRLYERMKAIFKENLERRSQEQRSLRELASLLASSLDMRMVLSQGLALIKKSCWADYVWLLGLEPEGAFILNASTDRDFPTGEIIYSPGARTIEQTAAETRKPFIAQGFAAASEMSVHGRVKGYSSACAVPVLLGEKALGVFTLYFHAGVDLAEDDLHFLGTIGSVMSVAIERARLYDNAIFQRGMANAVLESINDGVLTVDRAGNVTSINRAASSLLAVETGKAVGMPFLGLMGNDEENAEVREKLDSCLSEAFHGGCSCSEASFIKPGGSRTPLMIQCAPVFGKDTTGVVFVLRDVGRERELDMLKTDFVRSVSHEFRYPLTSIIGMAEMVLEGDVNGDRAREYIEAVLSEAKRLSYMVSDVLETALIESGKEGFSPQDIDLHAIARHAIEATEPLAHKKQSAVHADISGEAQWFRGDEERLRQMLRHLLENALIYSDPGKAVALRIEAGPDSIRIAVADKGWGISEDDIPHMGEKFYRGRNTRGTKGAGLGLSLCKKIARLHNGTLNIASSEGQGTTVTITLPRG